MNENRQNRHIKDSFCSQFHKMMTEFYETWNNNVLASIEKTKNCLKQQTIIQDWIKINRDQINCEECSNEIERIMGIWHEPDFNLNNLCCQTSKKFWKSMIGIKDDKFITEQFQIYSLQILMLRNRVCKICQDIKNDFEKKVIAKIEDLNKLKDTLSGRQKLIDAAVVNELCCLGNYNKENVAYLEKGLENIKSLENWLKEKKQIPLNKEMMLMSSKNHQEIQNLFNFNTLKKINDLNLFNDFEIIIIPFKDVQISVDPNHLDKFGIEINFANAYAIVLKNEKCI